MQAPTSQFPAAGGNPAPAGAAPDGRAAEATDGTPDASVAGPPAHGESAPGSSAPSPAGPPAAGESASGSSAPSPAGPPAAGESAPGWPGQGWSGQAWSGPGVPPPPPGYGPPAPDGGQWYPGGAPVNRTNPYAIASLICSLAGLVTGITAIAGVVLGHIALNQIKHTGEEGRTLAIAGLAVGYALLVLGVLIIVASLAFLAFFGAVATTTAVSPDIARMVPGY